MQTVIIGNSAAALSAVDRFRALDPASRVTLIAGETGPAYSRVLLPYFLRRRVTCERLFIRRPADYARLGAETRFGRTVTRVEPGAGRLELDDGRRLPFDRLLVATGSRPVLPPIPGLPGSRVHHLWTLADALGLEPHLLPGRRLLVIGSGFVALQAAWAAVQRGLGVVVLELLPRILPKVLDPTAAALLSRRMEEHGVEVLTGARTESVERLGDGRLRVQIDGRPPLEADRILVGAGVRPNLELLPDAPAGPGIPVDAGMRTAWPEVFAAGDVALGPSVFGEAHEPQALWPTAVEQGRVAGANLAGAAEVYRGCLNMNVTELFGLTVASMGRWEEGPGVESYGGLERGRYLRVLLQEGVPVGGVAVGTAEEAARLGLLRPLIRFRRPLRDAAGWLEGRSLPEQLRLRASMDRGW